MPLFEYECRGCGHVTTFLESRNTVSAHPCDKCGSKKTEKLFSTFAAHSQSSSRSKAPTGGCYPSCGSGACPRMS